MDVRWPGGNQGLALHYTIYLRISLQSTEPSSMRKDEVISVMKGREGREDSHEEHGRRTENPGVNDIATIFTPPFQCSFILEGPWGCKEYGALFSSMKSILLKGTPWLYWACQHLEIRQKRDQLISGWIHRYHKTHYLGTYQLLSYLTSTNLTESLPKYLDSCEQPGK